MSVKSVPEGVSCQPDRLLGLRPVTRRAGLLALVLWTLTCLRWFDAGQPFRPRALAAVPPLLLALPAAAFGAAWLVANRRVLLGPAMGPPGGLWLVIGLALLFRLPLAWWGGAGYLTADGSLSGIMAVHIRNGMDHPVFIPNSGYSGSLKAHLTVPLAMLVDMPRAFALASVLFYGIFVAAVYRLGSRADPRGSGGLLAAVYAAFAPAWVTHYSLSNDGNYVEVLAFGAWALFLSVLWIEESDHRPLRAMAIGLLLGLGFWCHILAVMPAIAAIGALLAFGRWEGLRALPRVALGFAAGDLPGLLWNAGNDWFSFGYLVTGAHQDHPAAASAFYTRIMPMVTDHWPILLGYDSWYPPVLDALSRSLAWGAVAATLLAVAKALLAARRGRERTLTVLLVFTIVNVGLAVVGAEHIQGNPRYLLFLMIPIPVFLAVAYGRGAWRAVLGCLIAFGALGSLATFPPSAAADARWRAFVASLESEGVRFCHTDFYLAARINFLSEERVLCSSRLGPTFSDYFHYAERVDPAPEVDFVAINRTRAGKIEARLKALGVSYERRDLMKPVFLRLSRKVDPDELRGDVQPPESTRR
jgi:Dolichyl-phosphate-mannose-protein mannosyltransferase